MTDDLGRELGAWLRAMDARPADPAMSLRRTMANVARTSQASPSRLAASVSREPIPTEPARDPSVHHTTRVGQDRPVQVTTGGPSRMVITATAMAVTIVVVLGGSFLLSGLVAGPTPQPIGPSQAPPTEAPLALAGTDTARDDAFELTISTPRTTWTADEPIEVTTSLAYLGREPRTLSGMGGDVVHFEVEQLDGPIDTGQPPRDLMCGDPHEYAPGDVQAIPFHKSGAWDPEVPLGSFWQDWLDDPELRLPAGTYRIVAHALYGSPRRCDASALEAAVTIKVVDAVATEPTVDWGPLAVVSEGGAPDAGLGPGTLSIGDECVTLLSDRGGEGVTLVWLSDQTTWKPTERQIVFERPTGEIVRLSDGDRVMFGGVGSFVPPSTQAMDVDAAAQVAAQLEEVWVQPPVGSCPTARWLVNEVRLPSSEGIKATSDLRSVARANGWTIEEAKLQEKATQEIGGVSSTIAEERPDIWIGGALSEQPGGPPSLYIKGPAPQAVRDLVAEADYLIILIDEQPYSFDELEKRKDRVHQALLDAGYTNVASGVDITGGGAIPVSLLEEPGLPTDPAGILAFVPAELRADVELDVVAAPPRPSAEPEAWGPLAVVYEPGGFGPGVGLGPVTLHVDEACVWIEHEPSGQGTTLVWEGDQVDWRPALRRIVFTDRKGRTVRLADGDRIEGGGTSLSWGDWPYGDGSAPATPEPGRRWDASLDDAWVRKPDPSCPERLFYLSEVTVLDRNE